MRINFLNKVLAAVVAMAFTGCSLQEEPYALTAEKLTTTEEGTEQLVTGVYATFWDHWCMQQTYMAWMDYDHDHCGGPAWVLGTGGSGDITGHWAYNTGNDLWNIFYCMINRANKAIETLEGNGSYAEDPTTGQLYGETLFLRAFAYFHLVRMYGEVPIRLSAETENDCPRSPVKDVYDVITSDLEKSLDYLHYPSDGNVGAWGHADKTAAQILLARVYATMGSIALTQQSAEMIVDIKGENKKYVCDKVDGGEGIDATQCYTRVKQLCDEVIARKGIDFDLMPEYLSIWGGNNRRNKEFVWGAAANASDETYRTSGLNNYFTPGPFGGSGCWIYMSHNHYNQYDEDDDRIVHGVFHYYLTSYTAKSWVSYPSGSERYNAENLPEDYKSVTPDFNSSYNKGVACLTKYYLEDIAHPSFYKAKLDAKTDQDVILIRFAEAYLLRAEAEVELGQVANAMADLDVIRKRAKATTLYTGNVTDKVEARSLVLKERSLELAMEFNRKFDLLRWGLYLGVMNDTKSIDCAGTLRSTVRTKKNLLYAIPSAELSSNSMITTNNYGY